MFNLLDVQVRGAGQGSSFTQNNNLVLKSVVAEVMGRQSPHFRAKMMNVSLIEYRYIFNDSKAGLSDVES